MDYFSTTNWGYLFNSTPNSQSERRNQILSLAKKQATSSDLRISPGMYQKIDDHAGEEQAFLQLREYLKHREQCIHNQKGPASKSFLRIHKLYEFENPKNDTYPTMPHYYNFFERLLDRINETPDSQMPEGFSASRTPKRIRESSESQKSKKPKKQDENKTQTKNLGIPSKPQEQEARSSNPPPKKSSSKKDPRKGIVERYKVIDDKSKIEDVINNLDDTKVNELWEIVKQVMIPEKNKRASPIANPNHTPSTLPLFFDTIIKYLREFVKEGKWKTVYILDVENRKNKAIKSLNDLAVTENLKTVKDVIKELYAVDDLLTKENELQTSDDNERKELKEVTEEVFDLMKDDYSFNDEDDKIARSNSVIITHIQNMWKDWEDNNKEKFIDNLLQYEDFKNMWTNKNRPKNKIKKILMYSLNDYYDFKNNPSEGAIAAFLN